MAISHLATEERNGDVDGQVLKSGDGDVGLDVDRLSGDVEKDVVAVLGGGDAGLELGQRLGSAEADGVVLLAANRDVHVEAGKRIVRGFKTNAEGFLSIS